MSEKENPEKTAKADVKEGETAGKIEPAEKEEAKHKTKQKPKTTSKKECSDRNCPTHGTLATRGASFDGTVVSDKMKNTVIVLREYMVKSPKYERYLLHRSKIPSHNPPCINAETGDKVKIMECRKLSKTVSFVVVEKQDG